MASPKNYTASELKRKKRANLNRMAPRLGVNRPKQFRNKNELIKAIIKAQKLPDPLHKITHLKKRAFLLSFAECGNIRRAAEESGVTRRAHYFWLKEDPDYAEAFEDAKEMAIEALEEEARRRAHDGVDKPVFYKGDKVATVKEYSDTLLIFLLKSLRPEKYRDHYQLEHTGPGGEPIAVQIYLPDNERDS